MATTVSVAVQELLKKHDGYNMIELRDFIKDKYQSIPKSVVPYLVKTSVEAAWYVAKTYHVFDCYSKSSEPKYKMLVEKSKQSMLAWFSGLRPEKSLGVLFT